MPGLRKQMEFIHASNCMQSCKNRNLMSHTATGFRLSMWCVSKFELSYLSSILILQTTYKPWENIYDKDPFLSQNGEITNQVKNDLTHTQTQHFSSKQNKPSNGLKTRAVAILVYICNEITHPCQLINFHVLERWIQRHLGVIWIILIFSETVFSFR